MLCFLLHIHKINWLISSIRFIGSTLDIFWAKLKAQYNWDAYSSDIAYIFCWIKSHWCVTGFSFNDSNSYTWVTSHKHSELEDKQPPSCDRKPASYLHLQSTFSKEARNNCFIHTFFFLSELPFNEYLIFDTIKIANYIY